MPRHHARFSGVDTPLGRKVREQAVKKDMTLREVYTQLGMAESTFHRCLAGVFSSGEALDKVKRFAESK